MLSRHHRSSASKKAFITTFNYLHPIGEMPFSTVNVSPVYGINDSPLSLEGTLESLVRETTPPCLPTFPLPLSLSSFSHFTHLLTEMQSQAQLSRQHSPCSLPNAKTCSQAARCRAPVYVSTEQHYMPESTTTEGSSTNGVGLLR